MLFALCLAFSVGSFAQDYTNQCPDGGTFQEHPELGPICSTPAPEGQSSFAYGKKGEYFTGRWPNPAQSAVDTHNETTTGTQGGLPWTNVDTVIVSNIPSTPRPFQITVERKYTFASNPPSISTFTAEVSAGELPPAKYCPPDNYPKLLSFGGQEPNLFCWAPAVQPPCDCSDLTGSNPQGINYFYAANGTYSQANPPNCISRDDNEDGDIPSCNCKLIATKWSSADVNINGTIYQRWQPIPDQNGVTGVFTGGQCDESEKDTPPDTPEKCYQLGNGQNFCLEDPDQKCAKIDGIMTCEAGCGTVNGEFFCFENDEPEEPLPDPDDNITDPDTPLNDMVKRDFKDVLGGTESRLDILARLMSDIKTNTSKGDSDLAAKQDATNRLLKEISDKLDEEGDDETPTNPQPTYNTDKLQEFVNPNDWGEKNFRTVAVAFKDRIMQTPIMQTVQNFFNVALSGTCPTWQTTVNMPFGGTFDININQLCSEAMTNIWPSIRAIIVLIFTFLAFKVAFTNE